MHRLLKRQLQRIFSKEFTLGQFSEGEQKLIEVINKTYVDNDKERKFIEHTLELNSQELNQQNREAHQALAKLADAHEMLHQERRELIEARQMADAANRAKSEFLANMSHELRSPMTSIRSGLSTIKEVLMDPEADDEDNADMMQAIDFAQGSSNRLMGLLNDILDLAKLEAGKMEFNIQPADLAEVIKLAVQEISSQAQAKSLSLKSDIYVPDTIIPIDFGKIMQVVINLLNNAVKFTPEGREICISLSKGTLPSGRRKTDVGDCPALKLIVNDQGVGIPEDELSFIFDKFAQSKKTKDGSGGTGLGLSIVQNIVFAHNGSIHVENNPQGGANFIVSLPR